MDNSQFSKLVSSRVSTNNNAGIVETNDLNSKRRRRDLDDDEKRNEQQRYSKKQRNSLQHTKLKQQSEKESNDRIPVAYRDRAKERREGVLLDDDEDSKTFSRAQLAPSDAKFEAAVTEFENTDAKVHRTTERDGLHDNSPLVNRGCFDTVDQAMQWVNGNQLGLPFPQSDVANGLVELLRTKSTQGTHQQLSIHRAYYLFGTQWNPWWERPIMNTFYNSASEKPQWSPFPDEEAQMLTDACRRISRQNEPREPHRHGVTNQDETLPDQAVETSDEDDIFAGAGDYNAADAIKEEQATLAHPVLKGPIFGSSATRKTANETESNINSSNAAVHPSLLNRSLIGFSEKLEAPGVDMDFEVHERDRKKKKRRRKKDDDDSEE